MAFIIIADRIYRGSRRNSAWYYRDISRGIYDYLDIITRAMLIKYGDLSRFIYYRDNETFAAKPAQHDVPLAGGAVHRVLPGGERGVHVAGVLDDAPVSDLAL